MPGNGVHLSEFGHMDVAEAVGLALWHSDLSISMNLFGLVIFMFLLRVALNHLGLDSSSISTDAFHQQFRLVAEFGLLGVKLVFESWGPKLIGRWRRLGFGWGVVTDSELDHISIGIFLNGIEPEEQARVCVFGCALLRLAGMHFFARWTGRSHTSGGRHASALSLDRCTRSFLGGSFRKGGLDVWEFGAVSLLAFCNRLKSGSCDRLRGLFNLNRKMKISLLRFQQL